MSQILKIDDFMILIAEYNDPEIHKHLASHIIISLGEDMKLNIKDSDITCRGVCINSNVKHTGSIPKEGAIIFLFTQVSDYALSLNEKYLNGKAYAILEDKIVDKILDQYFNNLDARDSAKEILNICGVNNLTHQKYDKRIQEVLNYIDRLETIDNKIVEDICKFIFLSKSRLSHLFKEETGMTMHSYLALAKIKKAYAYIEQGKNITESCLIAGFDSSSHFSATCKRMFGISLRDVKKKIASN